MRIVAATVAILGLITLPGVSHAAGARGPSLPALVRECDRLAGFQQNPDRPANAPFTDWDYIQPSLAIPACTRAMEATSGNARMMAQLARAHQKNGDNATARRLHEQAAAKGDSSAMNTIGYMWESGQGVTQDYAQARHWYERAVAKGNGDAITNLADLYVEGLGVRRDLVRARSLYRRAADLGVEAARRWLAEHPR